MDLTLVKYHLLVIVDIDECDGIPKPCHVNGVCNNTFGSFECTCKPGFSGVGLTSCVGMILYFLLFNYK